MEQGPGESLAQLGSRVVWKPTNRGLEAVLVEDAVSGTVTRLWRCPGSEAEDSRVGWGYYFSDVVTYGRFMRN